MPDTKVCSRGECTHKGKPQPLSSFSRSLVTPTGYRYHCKDCDHARQKTQRDGYRARHLAALEGGAARPAVKVNAPVPPAPVAATPAPMPQEEPAVQTAQQLAVARLNAEITRLKAYNRELQQQALSSHDLRALIGTLGSPSIVAQPDWLKGAKTPRSTTGTAVLLLSDIHFDEVVRGEEIGGCNEYNREIGTRRLQNTFRNTVALLKGYMNAPSYDGIVCALGGDMVSGNIHDELVETNEAAITQTMVALEEILIEGLGGLADAFGKVHVPCVTGNHGRMHKKPRAKGRAHHNFEWLIYQRVASYFRSDARLTFDIPDGPDAYFSVYNLRHCLTHGDQFRGGNGIGGIMVPIMRGLAKKSQNQQAIGDPFDIALIGHWHQYVHTRALVINGSVKGYDEYAHQNNFAFEPPQQALFIEHPKMGATFRMPVLCNKAA